MIRSGTGWAFEELTLNTKTVPNLTLLWKSKAENESYSLSALTAPVVAEKVSTVKGIRLWFMWRAFPVRSFALEARNRGIDLDLQN